MPAARSLKRTIRTGRANSSLIPCTRPISGARDPTLRILPHGRSAACSSVTSLGDTALQSSQFLQPKKSAGETLPHSRPVAPCPFSELGLTTLHRGQLHRHRCWSEEEPAEKRIPLSGHRPKVGRARRAGDEPTASKCAGSPAQRAVSSAEHRRHRGSQCPKPSSTGPQPRQTAWARYRWDR
jgi:hypothetical protein